MKAFELQTYRDGRWTIESVFEDRKLVLFEAQKIDEGTRYAGVRVIEEIYNEDSNSTTTRTIFEGRVADRTKKVQPSPANRRGGARKKTPKRTQVKQTRAKRKAKKSKFVVPVLILLAVLLGGLGALFGLQHLSMFR